MQMVQMQFIFVFLNFSTSFQLNFHYTVTWVKLSESGVSNVRPSELAAQHDDCLSLQQDTAHQYIAIVPGAFHLSVCWRARRPLVNLRTTNLLASADTRRHAIAGVRMLKFQSAVGAPFTVSALCCLCNRSCDRRDNDYSYNRTVYGVFIVFKISADQTVSPQIYNVQPHTETMTRKFQFLRLDVYYKLYVRCCCDCKL